MFWPRWKAGSRPLDRRRGAGWPCLARSRRWRRSVAWRTPNRPGSSRTVEATAPSFAATALGHPLLADGGRVANDVQVGPSGTFLLVTGSNMSGKSTLLRAIGTNSVLAGAGRPVCAAALADATGGALDQYADPGLAGAGRLLLHGRIAPPQGGCRWRAWRERRRCGGAALSARRDLAGDEYDRAPDRGAADHRPSRAARGDRGGLDARSQSGRCARTRRRPRARSTSPSSSPAARMVRR